VNYNIQTHCKLDNNINEFLAGVWVMHCHFERHLSWGMDTVFIVKNGPSATTSIRGQPPKLPTCRFKPLLHDIFNVTTIGRESEKVNKLIRKSLEP
jgi:hypothetical protein